MEEFLPCRAFTTWDISFCPDLCSWPLESCSHAFSKGLLGGKWVFVFWNIYICNGTFYLVPETASPTYKLTTLKHLMGSEKRLLCGDLLNTKPPLIHHVVSKAGWCWLALWLGFVGILIHHRSPQANIESLLKVGLVPSLLYSPPGMKVFVVFFSLLKYLSPLNFFPLLIFVFWDLW